VTVVNAGGVIIRHTELTKKFKKDYRKLSNSLQDNVDTKLEDLLKYPRPSSLRFEHLQGYHNPKVYSIHVTGNYKISFEIIGDTAKLRRVGNHDLIDRCP